MLFHGKLLFLQHNNNDQKSLIMKLILFLRSAVACMAMLSLLCVSSCKSRQYVGPVNGKILTSEDLMKDDDKKSDEKPIQQVSSLDEGQQSEKK